MLLIHVLMPATTDQKVITLLQRCHLSCISCCGVHSNYLMQVMCLLLTTCCQDLLRAAEKAVASGLGDWHLQALQNVSPQFQEHVLLGPLGPETLKHKHQLPEQQILQLYGILHRHSTGFQQDVQAALAGAQHIEQLLASIWMAFAQLWNECVQVSLTAAMRQPHSSNSLLHPSHVCSDTSDLA